MVPCLTTIFRHGVSRIGREHVDLSLLSRQQAGQLYQHSMANQNPDRPWDTMGCRANRRVFARGDNQARLPSSCSRAASHAYVAMVSRETPVFSVMFSYLGNLATSEPKRRQASAHGTRTDSSCTASTPRSGRSECARGYIPYLPAFPK